MDFIQLVQGTAILSEEEPELFTESFLACMISQSLAGGDYLVLSLPESSKHIQAYDSLHPRSSLELLPNIVLDYMWLLSSLNVANLNGDVLKF